MGIERQALSIKVDVHGRDYPTEFYERVAAPERDMLERFGRPLGENGLAEMRRFLPMTVKMERTHLNSWTTFMERTASVPDYMRKLLAREDVSDEDLFATFRALNACRF